MCLYDGLPRCLHRLGSHSVRCKDVVLEAGSRLRFFVTNLYGERPEATRLVWRQRLWPRHSQRYDYVISILRDSRSTILNEYQKRSSIIYIVRQLVL